MLNQCKLSYTYPGKSQYPIAVVKDQMTGSKNPRLLLKAAPEQHWNYKHHTPDTLLSGYCPIWKQERRPSDTTKTTRGKKELYIIKPEGKTKNNNPNLSSTNA